MTDKLMFCYESSVPSFFVDGALNVPMLRAALDKGDLLPSMTAEQEDIVNKLAQLDPSVVYDGPAPELREISSRECTGYAAVWGVVDSYNSTFEPGCFRATIEKGSFPLFLYNHDKSRILGPVVELNEDKKGLFYRARFTQGVSDADEVRNLLIDKAISGVSFGFNIRKEKWDGGVRRIMDVDLKEISIVPFPANEQARVSEVRAESSEVSLMNVSDGDKEPGIRSTSFNETDKMSEIQNRGYRLLRSLESTLFDIWWGSEKADVPELIDSVLSSFSEAYSQWASDFLMATKEEERSIPDTSDNRKIQEAYVQAFGNKPIREVATESPFSLGELRSIIQGEGVNFDVLQRVRPHSEELFTLLREERASKLKDLRREVDKPMWSFKGIISEQPLKTRDDSQEVEVRQADKMLDDLINLVNRV